MSTIKIVVVEFLLYNPTYTAHTLLRVRKVSRDGYVTYK